MAKQETRTTLRINPNIQVAVADRSESRVWEAVCDLQMVMLA